MNALHSIDYNLKGQKRKLVLSGVDLITGPNGSGKSTALIALVAGLRGLAQSPGDLEKPYIGPERAGSVVLAFDAGVIERDLSQGSAAKAATKASYDAERIAGAHLVRWDLGDFSTVSDTNREKLLRSICGNVSATSLKLPESPLLGELLKAERLEQDAGVWLEKALKWAAAAYTEANAAQKTAVEGAKSAGEQADQAAPAGTLSGAKVEHDRLRAEVAKLEAEKATATSRAAQAQRAEAQRNQAAERHAQAEQERDALAVQLQQPAPDVAGLKAALDAAEAALKATVEKNRAADSRTQQGDSPRKVLLQLEAKKSRLEGQIAALETQLNVVCHHCRLPDPLAMGAQIAPIRLELQALEMDLEDARLEVELDDKRAQRLGESYAAASKAELEARDAWRMAFGVGTQRIQIQARHDALTQELARLHAQIQGDAVEVESFGSAEILVALQDQLKEAATLLDQHTRHAERGRIHQESIAKREAALARFEAAKELGKALRTLQGEVAEKAWGPLQTGANELLGAMSSPFRVVFKSAADFGATDNRRAGAYVAFWSLSDAERATVGAALALAMVRLAKSPWPALVIDGLEKMDADTLEGFLCGVVQAKKEGWLANFIGAQVADSPLGEMDGIREHWLGPST
jgi:DNA repair exonuclease SbcCD ATPase subunit